MLSVAPRFHVSGMHLGTCSIRLPLLDHLVDLLLDLIRRLAVLLDDLAPFLLCGPYVLAHLLVLLRVDLRGIKDILVDAHDCTPPLVLRQQLLHLLVHARPHWLVSVLLGPLQKYVDDLGVLRFLAQGVAPDDAVVVFGWGIAYSGTRGVVTPDLELVFDPGGIGRVTVF